jgi:hypothetical protein
LWNAFFRWKKLQDEDLSDMTEVVVSDMDLGLEEDTITTYWLSYDRFIGFLIYSQSVNNYSFTCTSLKSQNIGRTRSNLQYLLKYRKVLLDFFWVFLRVSFTF